MTPHPEEEKGPGDGAAPLGFLIVVALAFYGAAAAIGAVLALARFGLGNG